MALVHPETGEVLAVWPRARVTLRQAEGKERVRQLPGANAALVEAAVLSSGSADRQLWWHGMDTDPDSSPQIPRLDPVVDVSDESGGDV